LLFLKFQQNYFDGPTKLLKSVCSKILFLSKIVRSARKRNFATATKLLLHIQCKRSNLAIINYLIVQQNWFYRKMLLS